MNDKLISLSQDPRYERFKLWEVGSFFSGCRQNVRACQSLRALQGKRKQHESQSYLIKFPRSLLLFPLASIFSHSQLILRRRDTHTNTSYSSNKAGDRR